MFEVTIGKNAYKVEKDGSAYLINGKRFEPTIHPITDTLFAVQLHDQVLRVKKLEEQEQSWTIEINGQKVDAALKDQYDLLLEKMGLDQLLASGPDDIKAPMPGKVLQILIKEKADVKAGDPLLVLEAMKMENVIKASSDAVVTSIAVKEGQPVEKNHVLLTFE